ncbi:MAG: DNA-directed polymerase [Variovorax sp.]|nr:DNA-directed polymerase [Variovorax sp.]
MSATPEVPGLAPWLVGPLSDLLRQRGHAWLLQGPSGLGQYELALALASAWLCEQPTGQGACGRCGSCHAVAVRTHADLCVLMPEITMQELGWPLDERAQSDIDDKKRKPGREIRVEAMRDAVGFAQRTSARGRGKVVLVYPAERMNPITANALLKTLEEPVGDVRFVLATEAAWQLLPTIRSRCLGFTLPWPEATDALNWLASHGIASGDAAALLRAAGGRPRDALRLARDGHSPQAWAQLPRALQSGDATALSGRSAAQAIDAMQKLCHDLMAQQCGAAPRFFEPADLPPVPSSAVLARWSKSLAQSARTEEHPFNAGLFLEALASDAHNALTLVKPDRRPRYP